ncbi:MAG: spore coat protein [Lachnospirales bacterium]
MTEKEMTQDVFYSNNMTITLCTNALMECKNKHIRQKIKEIRDGSEFFYEDLEKLCSVKGYLLPQRYVSEVEIEKTKNFLEKF